MTGSSGVSPDSAVQRVYSSESEEPFDQTKETMRGRQLGLEEELEDGDLPSLTRKSGRMGGRMVNGQRTTTRPLSPPSMAGLEAALPKSELSKQRQFWNQFDEDEDEAEDESDDDRDEDGPDDEVAARKAPRTKKKHDEESSRMSWTLESQSNDDNENNFCGQTLNAIGEMCGAGLALAGSPDKSRTIKESPNRTGARSVSPGGSRTASPNYPRGKSYEPRGGRPHMRSLSPTSRSLEEKSEKQEEMTAIEVEFVEPAVTPERKNAYLSAMAKKAKEDYEKNKDKVEPSAYSAKTEQPVSSDVYHSFTASEKRKFLKLINSGVSPSGASEQIVAERSKEKPKKGKFAFWKKSSSPVPPEKQEAPSEMQLAAKPEEVEEEPISVDQSTEQVNGESKTPAAASSSVAWAPVEPKPQVPVETRAPPTTEDAAPESDSSEGEHFAKSGISYYDAVRKDQDDDDSDEYVPSNAGKPKSGHRIPLPAGLKPKGFAMLDGARSKSAGRFRSPSEGSESGPLPPRVDRPSAAPVTKAKSFGGVSATPVSRTVQTLGLDEDSALKRIDEQDAEALERIEQSLLRPIPKSTSPSVIEGKNEVVQRAADSFAKLPAVPVVQAKPESNTIESQPKVPKSKKNVNVELETMDASMHTYFSSTERYASPVQGTSHDGMSVYTAQTGMTGASTYTQSTRVRRPGAAKSRLAKAKEVSSKKGWHESMKAVAEATNRRWDPKQGWIDFKDSDTSFEEQEVSTQRLHLDLQQKVRMTARKGDDTPPSQTSQGVQVPFPPDWEKERKLMVASPGQLEEGEAPNELRSSSKASGWVESMRTASAVVEKDGKVWDPQTGWRDVRQNGKRRDVPDVVDFERTESEEVHGPVANEVGPSSRIDETSSRDGQTPPIPRLPPSSDKKLNQWIAKKTFEDNPPKHRSAASTESSDKAVASGLEDESYMQLAENGRVRTFSKDGPPSPVPKDAAVLPVSPSLSHGQAADTYISDDDDDDDDDDDTNPLLSRDSGSFPSVNVKQDPISPVTNVVKEKVDAEDFNLFQHEESKGSQLERQSVVSAATTSSAGRHSAATSSLGRRSAPVDLDEVDEKWQSDDDEDDDDGSETNRGGSFPTVERAGFPAEAKGASKPVPKLQMNKRDTSPLMVRKKAAHAITPSQSTIEPATPHIHTYIDAARLVTPDDASIEEKKVTGLSPDEGASGYPEMSGQRQKVKIRRPSAAANPSVQVRREEWEIRTGGSSDYVEATSETTPEWKSFLGKKMLAQTMASETMAISRQRETHQEGKEPEGDKWSYSTRSREDERERRAREKVEVETVDSDTLFHFANDGQVHAVGDNHAASPLDTSDLSPIPQGDLSDVERESSYGPDPSERRSFFKRLAECAAPVMNVAKGADGESSMPMAHLAFLRSNPHTPNSGAQFLPPSLCARVPVDDEDGEESVKTEDLPSRRSEGPAGTEKPHVPTSRTRGRATEPRAPSSVVSDDFGAKTAYLDAIAMKAAVSKPKSRRRSRSAGGSSVASNSSSHSEKWKAFLERKRAGGTSPLRARPSSSTDVSRAAEKYASEKVEEMMTMMSSRSKPVPYHESEERQVNSEADRSFSSSPDTSMDWKHKKADSVRAAEDLAAARVEAMMAALSSSHLDEGEI